jgi:hypothetical protein
VWPWKKRKCCVGGRGRERTRESIRAFVLFDKTMAATASLRPKPKSSTAPDILTKPQNWRQKVSSLRLSNIRVGYQLASLISEKEMKSQDLFIPSFVRVVSHQGSYYILLGGITGIKIYQIIESNDVITIELIYEDLNLSCIDCCIYNPCHSSLFSHSPSSSSTSSSASFSFALLFSNSKSHETTHFIRTVIVDQHLSPSPSPPSSPPSLPLPSRSGYEHQYEGIPEKIASTNSFLLVAVSPGALRIFYGEQLHPITEIPSVYHSPVIFATAPRWIAVQSEFPLLLTFISLVFSPSKGYWNNCTNKCDHLPQPHPASGHRQRQQRE